MRKDKHDDVITAMAYDLVKYRRLRPYRQYADKFGKHVEVVKKVKQNRKKEIKEAIVRLGGRPELFDDIPRNRIPEPILGDWYSPTSRVHDVDESLSLSDMFNIARGHKQLDREDAKAKRRVECKIETDRPVAVVMSSDWHFGALGVDYDSLERDIKFFLDNTEHLKMLMVGDMIENCISFPSAEAVLSQVFSPKEQRVFLEKLFEEMADHILAMWYGNHDVGRDLRQFGDSFVLRIAERHKIPFVGGPGPIELTIGDEKYKGFVSHHPKGYSMYNKLHGAIRWLRENCPNADFVTIAHKHQPAYSWVREYNRIIHLFALGTYNTEADYGFRRYGGGGAIGAPALVLWPNEHRTMAFSCAEDAITFIKALGE